MLIKDYHGHNSINLLYFVHNPWSCMILTKMILTLMKPMTFIKQSKTYKNWKMTMSVWSKHLGLNKVQWFNNLLKNTKYNQFLQESCISLIKNKFMDLKKINKCCCTKIDSISKCKNQFLFIIRFICLYLNLI